MIVTLGELSKLLSYSMRCTPWLTLIPCHHLPRAPKSVSLLCCPSWLLPFAHAASCLLFKRAQDRCSTRKESRTKFICWQSEPVSGLAKLLPSILSLEKKTKEFNGKETRDRLSSHALLIRIVSTLHLVRERKKVVCLRHALQFTEMALIELRQNFTHIVECCDMF